MVYKYLKIIRVEVKRMSAFVVSYYNNNNNNN